MRTLVQIYMPLAAVLVMTMTVMWSQFELSEAKIVHKVIAGIALPVVAGAGAGLAGGVVAGAVSGAHRDRGYHPPSTTYYTTYEHSYSTRVRPEPSPLLRHLRKAIRYSFEHRRRPQYASWLSAHAPHQYLRPSHTIYQTTHSYQPTYHGKLPSYHKAVYPHEESAGRTSSVDAQIECKVVSEDVSLHRKPPVEVPAHEEEAHQLYQPKGHADNDKPTKVLHEHHHFHDDEAEEEQEGRNLTDKDQSSRRHKGGKKYYHHEDDDSEVQHNKHHHHHDEDTYDDEEDSFARRRAIRRRTKRKNASKLRRTGNDRRDDDSKRAESRK